MIAGTVVPTRETHLERNNVPADLPDDVHNELVNAYNTWEDKDTARSRLTFLSRLAAICDAGWSQSAVSRSLEISREQVRNLRAEAFEERANGNLPTYRHKIDPPPPRKARRVAPGKEEVPEALINSYAKRLIELQPLAEQARGHHGPEAPERIASDQYSIILKEAFDDDVPITVLANKIHRHVAGLRTRIRTSEAIGSLGNSSDRRKDGVRDPKEVEKWAKKLRPILKKTEKGGPNVDREASEKVHTIVREAVVDNNISLRALAKACKRSYHSLWVRFASDLPQE